MLCNSGIYDAVDDVRKLNHDETSMVRHMCNIDVRDRLLNMKLRRKRFGGGCISEVMRTHRVFV